MSELKGFVYFPIEIRVEKVQESESDSAVGVVFFLVWESELE